MGGILALCSNHNHNPTPNHSNTTADKSSTQHLLYLLRLQRKHTLLFNLHGKMRLRRRTLLWN
jgi:hypothetical protein